MVLMRRSIAWSIAPAFILGSLAGSFIGGHTVVVLETWVLQLMLGLFVLHATWTPGFRSRPPAPARFFGVRLFSGFSTMFVGGSGPMVAPFVAASCPERQRMVATHAMLMTFQHLFKAVAFGVLGFAFGPYWPLLIGLLAFGAVGTYCGRFARLLAVNSDAAGLAAALRGGDKLSRLRMMARSVSRDADPPAT
jgi:uncharacterized membrane protein YfcA